MEVGSGNQKKEVHLFCLHSPLTSQSEKVNYYHVQREGSLPFFTLGQAFILPKV